MSRFTHCVVYFCETKHYAVLDRRIINGKISIGKSIFIEFPVRKEPFEAIVKSICESRDEADLKIKRLSDGSEDSNGNDLRDEENRSCSWSPEPPIKDEQQDSKDTRNNYVTSDLFCDVMNRVVEVLQGIQQSSQDNLKACVKEMVKINQNLLGESSNSETNGTEDSTTEKEDAPLTPTTKTASTPTTTKPKPPTSNLPKVSQPQRPQPAHNGRTGWPPPPPPPPPATVSFEDDIGGPSWEFVSREKVDEVFEDCENYKIFARKISYAIFDAEEQKLKMNERNKKKVSELRKIIKLKYPSERREFDDMIWRTCKNAVNNTTYNEAKRRKRHPALMLGTESSGQNFLASNYDSGGGPTPSKRTYDIPGQQEAFFKAEPQSEMDL